MELISKVINKVRALFGLNVLKNQQLLPENIVETDIGIANTIIADSSENNNNMEICDTLIAQQNKEDFFRMYNLYKEGKIKEEHLLITDLIDINLMLLEEQALLDKKIILEEANIKNQEKQIENLINKKVS